MLQCFFVALFRTDFKWIIIDFLENHVLLVIAQQIHVVKVFLVFISRKSDLISYI